MSRVYCIIPARMGSSRFPGKPLKKILGLSLIEHIAHRCSLYKGFERVVVATCDDEIRTAVEASGFEAVMTSDQHDRCTSRVEEAIKNMKLDLADDDIVLMVQGDEILLSLDMIQNVVDTQQRSGNVVVNLASKLSRLEDHDDPNTVKVVAGPDGRALYFSRAPIPSRARSNQVPMYQQTGVIGFHYEFLKRFSTLQQTPLEIIESVDMMRVIEHGFSLNMVFTDTETIGVDTPADLKRAESKLQEDPTTQLYLKI
jgi:3-deoxy-manno-octulosonate cytidylyltransferase (CMP-KDO synthetase)